MPYPVIQFLLCSVVLACLVEKSHADCFDDAAAWQGVHAGVLRAISLRENSRCDATVHINRNGSRDIGCMQINSIHLPELAAYGISADALKDRCVNIFVGARHYKKMLLKYGNTWTAVGAYHSETPLHRDAYARDVEAIFRKYRLDQVSGSSRSRR